MHIKRNPKRVESQKQWREHPTSKNINSTKTRNIHHIHIYNIHISEKMGTMNKLFRLLYMITITAGNLLDTSTQMRTSQTQCSIKDNVQLTDISIDPMILLDELRHELQKVAQIRSEIKLDSSNSRKSPMIIGTLEVKNITTESLMIELLDLMPSQLNDMIKDQQKIINLLSQSIYTTTDIRLKIKKTNLESNNILDQIPKVTKAFSTMTDFDYDFVASQALNLDQIIEHAMNKLKDNISHQIIANNREILAVQYEKIFTKELPDDAKIGFSQNTSPKDFTEYFGKWIEPKHMKKLLAIIQYIKANIAFQLQQKISTTASRSTQWIEKLKHRATHKQLMEYKEKENNIADIDSIQKRAIKATAFAASAGRKVLKVFAKQAKKHATNLIRKAINHKLMKEKERLKVKSGKPQNITQMNMIIGQYKKYPALGNTLIMRDGLTTIFQHRQIIAQMYKVQKRQKEYIQTIFTNSLPLQLLDTMPQQKCKISVSLLETTFIIRYEYFQNIQRIPTFQIDTVPFLLENKAFKLKIPSQIAILPNGKDTIIEPSTVCAPRCECTERTKKHELSGCIKAIIQNKYMNNEESTVQQCIRHITPVVPEQTTLIKSNTNTYSIFSPNQTKATISCGQQEQISDLQRGLNEVLVPYGCKLHTDNITLTNYEVQSDGKIENNKQNIKNDKQKIKTMKERILKAMTELGNNGNESITISLMDKQARIANEIKEVKQESIIHLITLLTLAVTTMLISITLSAIRIIEKCTKQKKPKTDSNVNEEMVSIFSEEEN